MMGTLEIIKPGLMTSIQDLGRKGLAYYGIPRSGVMDTDAARIANLLLGKREEDPLIECTSIAPKIKFHAATEIVITGADFTWKINNEPVPLNQKLSVKSEDILHGKFARNGMRGYITCRGKLAIDQVYGSYSTYMNAKIGGYKGRLLQKGDVLSWRDYEQEEKQRFTINKGPEYSWLTDEAKKILVSSPYKISSDTNRMGMRLNGKPLIADSNQLVSSAPILPGFVQVPPNGQPIIVLQDGQTTGGYPRIAYLTSISLSRLNQIPIHQLINFSIAD